MLAILGRRLLTTTSTTAPVGKPFYVPMGDHHAKRLRLTTLLSSSMFSLLFGAELYGWNLPPAATEDITWWTQLTSGSLLHVAGMAISLGWLASNQIDASVTVSEMHVQEDSQGGEDHTLLLIRPYTLLGRQSKRLFRVKLSDLEFQGYGTKPNLFFVKGTGNTLGKRRVFMFDRVDNIQTLFGTHRKSGMLPIPPPTNTAPERGQQFKSKRRRGL
ncbi:hypothetical protein BASA81_010742 [Batrachochytrium salamandrivorans]|nr:hypothetical protein BASA81_010742 [Batrachochytrium salamandrivorans]